MISYMMLIYPCYKHIAKSNFSLSLGIRHSSSHLKRINLKYSIDAIFVICFELHLHMPKHVNFSLNLFETNIFVDVSSINAMHIKEIKKFE